ncbi:bleomycin resistance protein [Muricoccus radiodurans]|uniref:bleomycin resistance protein n=1 Tax=Muricoccus radiodurans TaxID=2231721 RepID=UPI003CF2BAB8
MTRSLLSVAPVLAVSEVEAAIAHYVDRLGFTLHHRMGQPATYAIVERDALSLHLMPKTQDPTIGRTALYVFVADVDALHRELVARGQEIEVAPTDLSYGMREMSVRDPDGHRLTFGREIFRA